MGGGLLDAGLSGTWYADADFSDEAFTGDIRIDFDWGTLTRPGGGLASTRWGALAPTTTRCAGRVG